MLDDLDVLLVLSVASALAGLAVLVCLVGAARELVRGRRDADRRVEAPGRIATAAVAEATADDEDSWSAEADDEAWIEAETDDQEWSDADDEAWIEAETDDQEWSDADDEAWAEGDADDQAWAQGEWVEEPWSDDDRSEDAAPVGAAAEAAPVVPEPLPVWVPPVLDGAPVQVDEVAEVDEVGPEREPVAATAPEDEVAAPAASGMAELARMIDLGEARSRRSGGRRRRHSRHDRRRDDDGDVPARPRLPAGAERALLSIVEVQPDPRNLLALQRDPTAEVRLTDLDRATAAAARDRVEIAAARRRHPTAHVRHTA